MKKIDGIFFDVDQTIFDGYIGKMDESTVIAIKQAQTNGVKCFISTGRPYCHLLDAPLFDDIKWDGFVCSNGATLYDKDGKLIEANYFTISQVQQLIDICQKYQVGLAFQTLDSLFACLSYDDSMAESFRLFNNPIPPIKNYENENVNAALLYTNSNFDFNTANIIEGLEVIKGIVNYADVNIKGINKGTGILKMKELFKLNKIMSFGDADNNIEMLRAADIGVCMGNGTENMKKVANYVTTEIHDDGIYNALKHFNII